MLTETVRTLQVQQDRKLVLSHYPSASVAWTINGYSIQNFPHAAPFYATENDTWVGAANILRRHTRALAG